MRKRSFLVAAAILTGGWLQAQTDTTVKTLDEIVFTAHKYARKQSESGKLVHVITRAQLEQSGARQLGEILNQVPGTFIIGATNAPGTNLTASIRGASAGNVLILLDGVPVNDPSVITNYYDLNFIAPDQVERIEVLTGGQSTLYGSDAVAGVINIISRKGTNKGWSLNGQVSTGSFGTWQPSLGLGRKSDKIDWQLNYSGQFSRGFSSALDTAGDKGFDRDGIAQHSIQARAGYTFRPGWQLQLTGLYSRYKADLDAAAFTDERDFTADNDNRQWSLALVRQKGNWNWQTRYQFNRAERGYLDDSSYRASPFTSFTSSNYVGRTHFAETYASHKGLRWEWLAGLDYRQHQTDQWFFSTGAWGPFATPRLDVSLYQLSPYASVIFKAGAFQTEGGLRFNHHSVYGNNLSFTLNPSWRWKEKVKFYANLYSAFKTPTLYQLFDGFAGNKDLQPERGLIAEAGASTLGTGAWKARLTGFYRHTEDAIIYTFNPSTFAGRYLNASEQRNYGVEAELGYRAGRVEINADYTYTDGTTTAAFDGTGAPLGKDTSYFNLYRIPRHRVQLRVQYSLPKGWVLGLRVQGQGRREEFIYGAAPAEMDGFVLADLYAEYRLNARWKAFADLRNVTDTRYQEIRGYATRRFNASAGIRFQWSRPSRP